MGVYGYRSDDPVRDAEAYDLAQEDAPCIYCALCGAAMYDGEDYYEIDDLPYCPDCISDRKKEVNLSEYDYD